MSEEKNDSVVSQIVGWAFIVGVGLMFFGGGCHTEIGRLKYTDPERYCAQLLDEASAEANKNTSEGTLLADRAMKAFRDDCHFPPGAAGPTVKR